MIRMIEEMSLNAWPALEVVLCDGWVLRFADGYTRRANSVNPLYASTGDLSQKIALCERLYRERGLPVIFKLTRESEPRDLEAALVERGYERVAQTSVYTSDLAHGDDPAGIEIETSWARATEWREAFHRIKPVEGGRREAHDRILASIPLPTGFTLAREDGQVVGCALGVVQGDWLGVFDVVVGEAFRRRGHGERLMKGLSAWGKAEGAEKAYLQVMRENAAAQRLYQKLGFREAYPYWYRITA